MGANTPSMDHFTERQLAERLGISVRTLQAQRQRGGGIPFVKLGRAVRYARSDVEQYLEQHRHRSTSDEITLPTIYAEINAGRLRSFTIGRRRLVGLEALREWQKEAEAASKDRR